MDNTHDKFFRKYINNNIDAWIKVEGLEGNVDDIINFSRFLLIDSIGIKAKREAEKESAIYGVGGAICKQMQGKSE